MYKWIAVIEPNSNNPVKQWKGKLHPAAALYDTKHQAVHCVDDNPYWNFFSAHRIKVKE